MKSVVTHKNLYSLKILLNMMQYACVKCLFDIIEHLQSYDLRIGKYSPLSMLIWVTKDPW